jgi:hypothetical protein
VGSFLGLQVLDRKATVEDRCKNKVCDREGIEAGESGKTLSNLSTVAFSLGVLAAGVGAYLLLSTPRTDVSAGPGGVTARVRF